MIEEVFQTTKGSINKQYFGNSKFYYNKSATTGLYSLMVESTPSLYHLDTSAHLFARVKLSGKLQYISFSGTFEKDFAALIFLLRKSHQMILFALILNTS